MIAVHLKHRIEWFCGRCVPDRSLAELVSGYVVTELCALIG